MAEFDTYDGLGLAELVRRRQVTAAELVEAAIGRIQARNPRLNAVIQPMFDLARDAAVTAVMDGPFCGVPFVLKDLLAHHAGVPTRNGSRFHDGDVADHDSELVRRFMPYTAPFNITGQPAMSVPLHWNADDLPIGVHFIGRYADEATLFRLAGQLEQAHPWFDRTPTPEVHTAQR